MASLTTPQPAEAQADSFAERMLGIMTAGSLNLMISIGHRTGLFDTLAEMPPATSAEIAARCGLNERYVREWLGAMVTGAIVEYDAARQAYWLPAEHAAFLTRAATPMNMAATTQFFAVLAGVEDQIVECFRRGGGVPYEAFHRFHEVMAEESAQTVVSALSEHILPLGVGLVDQLRAGIDVLDIGCGSGRAVCFLAEEFPQSRFVGYDLCPDAVAVAVQQAEARGLTNARFEQHDVTQLGGAGPFDLVTAFDAIHDQARPDEVLRQIFTVLRPGGTFLMQDILASSHLEQNRDNPLGCFLYTISCMHCMTVSLAQDGAGLGTCWGRELAEQMLADAGFGDIRVEKLDHDEMNYYYFAHKPQ